MKLCKPTACTRSSINQAVRENLGDCESSNFVWSEHYLNFALQLAATRIANTHKEAFVRRVDFTLKNGECLQSACSVGCKGIIDFPANVNGNCDTPSKAKDETDKWLSKMYGPICSDSTDPYTVESVQVMIEGGCEFKVTPAVPLTGTYTLPLMCYVQPCIDSEQLDGNLCNYIDELFLLVLGIAYLLEDDRDMMGKANFCFTTFFTMAKMDRDVDRDVFIESIRYGIRLAKDEL